MNHEAISQLCFSEAFVVTPAQTVAALFGGLPFRQRRANRTNGVLAGAALLAHLESICIAALMPYRGSAGRSVLGRRMALDHRGAAPIGETVAVSGFVIELGERSVRFHVRAERAGSPDLGLLAEGTLDFVIVDTPPGARRARDPLPLAARA